MNTSVVHLHAGRDGMTVGSGGRGLDALGDAASSPADGFTGQEVDAARAGLVEKDRKVRGQDRHGHDVEFDQEEHGHRDVGEGPVVVEESAGGIDQAGDDGSDA
nr:hypothetical protein CFP56_36157 [Quercus suber]